MDKCQKKEEERVWRMSKDVNYRRMIQSVRWATMRREKLMINPLCQVCLQNGIYTSAQCVHHITACETARSIGQMEQLMFSMSNLMSLCYDCHVAIHKAMASHSRAAKRKNTDERNRRFVDKFFG